MGTVAGRRNSSLPWAWRKKKEKRVAFFYFRLIVSLGRLEIFLTALQGSKAGKRRLFWGGGDNTWHEPVTPSFLSIALNLYLVSNNLRPYVQQS